MELDFHSTMVNYQSVIRMDSTAVILPIIVEIQLVTVHVIIALITKARLLEFIQDLNKRFSTLFPQIGF